MDTNTLDEDRQGEGRAQITGEEDPSVTMRGRGRIPHWASLLGKRLQGRSPIVVYGLLDTAGVVFYVGCTTRLGKRLYAHANLHGNLTDAIVLQSTFDIETPAQAEQKWIREFISRGHTLANDEYLSRDIRIERKRLASLKTAERERLSREADVILSDPNKMQIFKEIMAAMAVRTSQAMTKEQRVSRAKAGAKARHENLTAEERSAHAKKAAATRWGKKS